MEEELERAIRILTGKVVQSVNPDHAIKLTQSAANLTHVLNCFKGETKKRAGS